MKKVATFMIILSMFMSCSIFNSESDYSLAKFDSQVWKDYNESSDNRRYEMIDDLFDNYLYEGMSQTEVSELLGTPHSESSDSYTYYIGWPPNSGSLFRIDGDVLCIEFEDYTVSRYFYTEG